MYKLLLPLAAFWGYSLLRTARAGSEMTFEPIGIHQLGIDLKKLQVTGQLSMRFVNPTNAPLTFSGLVLGISYDGTYLGDCIQRDPVVIRAKDATILDFPVSLGLLALGTKALTIASGLAQGKRLKNVNIKGRVTSAGIDVPISSTISLAQYLPQGSATAQTTKGSKGFSGKGGQRG